MAKKGNQQKSGVGRSSQNGKKKGSEAHQERGQATDVKIPPKETTANGHHSSNVSAESMRQGAGKLRSTEKQGTDAAQGLEHPVLSGEFSEDYIQNASPVGMSYEREQGGLDCDNNCQNSRKGGLGGELNGHITNLIANAHIFDNSVVRNVRRSASLVLKAAGEWLESQRPFVIKLKGDILKACDYVRVKIELAYPVALKWLVYFGNILFLLSMIWLDCTLRGIDSLLRMGTTSFFSIIWCGIFSIITMAGMPKFLVVSVLAVLAGIFVGFAAALLLLAICGAVFVWCYGSFWTTALVIILAGISFTLSHERLALFISTIYAVYSAWAYVGWMGLLLGLNLSFISSDALIYFLRNNIHQPQRTNDPPKQAAGMQDQPFSEPLHPSFSDAASGSSADRNSGIPSTSGANSEITSEDEVIRLLSCSDHYSALGFNRYENVDVSLLKREYRKKAMMVHPDKNQGNEKAAEAFKNLQNAYEVLLDSVKRKAYDDELRREELLNCLRRFQSSSQKNGGRGLFSSGFAHSETDGEDALRDSRRIACKKCNSFHLWLQTRKLKAQARWCQDCKEFHQAKDGDGWVEQSSQPLLFGLLQKMNAPVAYVCADSRIYDASEWYICQGMRCPPNTHKPSFHVNTSVTSKHNSGKGTASGQRGGRVPGNNVEETMTEEEFFAWLQNAVQAGIFDNFSSAYSENQSPGCGSSSKSGFSGSGSSGKKKKRGKKQW
ncbi:J domain-containing protein [Psidium guajava]|nr:J domain-containing protein [Psidium guajava]